MPSHGQGMPQNDVEAVTWFRLAAEQGDADGQVQLGVMYRDGKGVERNYTEAISWFRKAAEQGYTPGQVHLGLMYRDDKGVEQNYIEATSWFRKAEKGDVGFKNEHGLGVPKDISNASIGHKNSANHGFDDAQRRIEKLGRWRKKFFNKFFE
ncbi:hypothetical protein BGW42_007399 [Actinomortierella wolfii]|nr:hypothetical protein BGW42_007399 [Actinomortierella wolfii]